MRKLVLAMSVAAVSGWAAAQTPPPAPDSVNDTAGRIEAVGGTLAIGSAVSGVVASVKVGEGERVRAGQILASIDCRVIAAQAKTREQELAAASAILSRTRNGNRAEDIAIAAAAVKGAEANAEEAEIARQRAAALKLDNTATQARNDAAIRDARFTAAVLEEARQRLALLRAGSRAEDLAEAAAQNDAAAGRLDEARSRLDQCDIRAPVDGLVTEKRVTLGQFVSGLDQSPLLLIVDDSKRQVRMEVEPATAAKLCPGQDASISALGNGGAAIKGTLTRVGSVLTPTADRKDGGGTIAVTLSIDGQPGWPIGLPVAVHLNPCASGQSAPTP